MKETGWNCSESHAYPMISQYPVGLMTKSFISGKDFILPAQEKSSFGGGWTAHFKKKTCVQSGLPIPLNRVVKIFLKQLHSGKCNLDTEVAWKTNVLSKIGGLLVFILVFSGVVFGWDFIPKTSINQPMLAKQQSSIHCPGTLQSCVRWRSTSWNLKSRFQPLLNGESAIKLKPRW